MKRFSEQLHKKAETVKLRSTEKRELRERLISYMEYHPLPAEMKTVKQTKKNKATSAPALTDAFATFSIPFATIFKSSAVAAAIVLLVLPFAAEKAVPGDTLYAIKVQFNEELRSTLTFDSYQKVEWETERLNRRIAEARLLASEGRLTEEVEAEVANAVRTHTENAKREIEELRTQDADEATIASIALDTTLQVQSTSLRGDQEGQVTDPEMQANNLIANVIDESRIQTDAEKVPAAPPAYNKLMARVEMNTTRIYEYLNTLEHTVSEEEVTNVTRRIEDIERSIQEVIEISTTEDDKARLQLIDVLQRTQKLIVYMTELEVKLTVDIETLVPVVLTEVEEEALVVSMTEDVDIKIARINELYIDVEDTDILEKVDFTLLEIDEKSSIMASSTENLPVFRATANEAILMADDMIALLERHLSPIEEPVLELEEESATTTDSEIDLETEEIEETATSTEEVVDEEELPSDLPHDATGSSTEEVVIEEEVDSTATSTVDSI